MHHDGGYWPVSENSGVKNQSKSNGEFFDLISLLSC